MKKQGKVWLVGAGPGDVGLFTIKGKQVLEQAEVVVYDSLVGDGVLAMVPKNARLINAFNSANVSTFRQQHINRVYQRFANCFPPRLRLKRHKKARFVPVNILPTQYQLRLSMFW